MQKIKAKIEKQIEENKILFNILFVATCVFLIVFTVYFRRVYINYQSSDYTIYLIRWWNEIELNGIKSALSMSIGNYTEFYKLVLVLGTLITDNALLYIKISTMIFEVLFCFVIFLFCKNIFGKNTKTSILIMLISSFIPTIIMNGSVASQCDIIYTTMLILMLYYIFKEKYKLSLIFFGIAFAIKLQAIFVAPIILYLLIHKKVKIREIFLIPIPYIIFGIPAFIAGKPILDILLTYVNQTGQYSSWTINAPNIYQFFGLNLVFGMSKINTVILTMATGIFILGIILLLRKHYSKKMILLLSLLFALIIPFLLPKMHERYFFIADILSFIYIISFGIKRIPLHILIVLASLFSYANYLPGVYENLFGNNILKIFDLNILAAFNSVAIIIVVIDIIFEQENIDKEKLLKKESE